MKKIPELLPDDAESELTFLAELMAAANTTFFIRKGEAPVEGVITKLTGRLGDWEISRLSDCYYISSSYIALLPAFPTYFNELFGEIVSEPTTRGDGNIIAFKASSLDILQYLPAPPSLL